MQIGKREQANGTIVTGPWLDRPAPRRPPPIATKAKGAHPKQPGLALAGPPTVTLTRLKPDATGTLAPRASPARPEWARDRSKTTTCRDFQDSRLGSRLVTGRTSRVDTLTLRTAPPVAVSPRRQELNSECCRSSSSSFGIFTERTRGAPLQCHEETRKAHGNNDLEPWYRRSQRPSLRTTPTVASISSIKICDYVRISRRSSHLRDIASPAQKHWLYPRDVRNRSCWGCSLCRIFPLSYLECTSDRQPVPKDVLKREYHGRVRSFRSNPCQQVWHTPSIVNHWRIDK